jgi:RimJ/RimL family protein N-acetyltransferase
LKIRLQSCEIRSWRSEDAEAIVRHANNSKVWRNVRDRFPHPYTLPHAHAFIRRAKTVQPERVFAIVAGDEVAGGIGLELKEDVYAGTAEIGFWLGEAFWGRGIVTEAVRAVTEHGFSELGLRRIYATVFEWNPASARVLEKCGYALEGRMRKNVLKDGRVIDELLYARVRDED